MILFPLYVAFVAATLDKQAVYAAPMTLIPGTHLLENIHNAESENNLIKVLADCTKRLEQVNKNMEELISGSNGTGEYKRE